MGLKNFLLHRMDILVTQKVTIVTTGITTLSKRNFIQVNKTLIRGSQMENLMWLWIHSQDYFLLRQAGCREKESLFGVIGSYHTVACERTTHI